VPESDPETRRIAVRILAAQLLVTAIFAGIAGWIAGERAGGSAFVGGSIGIIANLCMTITALRPSADARQAVRRLYVGQAVKVGVTAVLFIAAARSEEMVWPALLATYVAMLVTFIWVPIRASARTAIKKEG